MTRENEENLQELREKIKGHILAIREDAKNAGFDTSYLSMASFEEYENGIERNSAQFTNGFHIKSDEQLDFFYIFTEEES